LAESRFYLSVGVRLQLRKKRVTLRAVQAQATLGNNEWALALKGTSRKGLPGIACEQVSPG
jgi:hypothetical protein